MQVNLENPNEPSSHPATAETLIPSQQQSHKGRHVLVHSDLHSIDLYSGQDNCDNACLLQVNQPMEN